MQHLQMKADMIAHYNKCHQKLATISTVATTSATSLSPAEAQQIQAQANDILAQFSAPIMSELMTQFSQQIGTPPEEDPLVTIRKQELALKGQQLNQDQQQFMKREERADQLDQSRQDQIDRERIDTSRDIAIMKDNTTKDRLDQQKELKLIDIGLKRVITMIKSTKVSDQKTPKTLDGKQSYSNKGNVVTRKS